MEKKELKNYQKIDFTDIKSAKCTNKKLSNLFISDFLKVSGYEVDKNGYIMNIEDDILNPEYVTINGKFLRHTIQGVLHNNDIAFDPYNDIHVIETLFVKYLDECHPQISSFQIIDSTKVLATGYNNYGQMIVLYNNGGQIITDKHWKDSTKFLDMWYRLESHDPDTIRNILKEYDEYESKYYLDKKYKGVIM